MNSHRNSLISWFASNPVAANLLMILILGAGLVSVFSIEKRTLPDFETNTISIVVPFPGAGPREVEQGVVLKIEEAIVDSLGIEKVISVSRDGSAQIDVVVASGYDIDQLMDEIKRKIDAVSALPRDSERPIISKTEPRMQVQWLSIYGASDVRRLQPLATRVRDDLLAMPEIEEILVVGDPTFEISIEAKPHALQQYDLTFSRLAETISGSSTDIAAGVMRTRNSNISIRSVGQAYDREDFAGIVVKTRPDGLPLIQDVAAAGGDDPLQHLHGGGLAGAIGAQQAEDLTLANLEVDILERLESSGVSLGQAFDRNLWVHAPYYTTDLRIRGSKTILNIRMMH